MSQRTSKSQYEWDRLLLSGSRLFDAQWYLADNDDVAKAQLDPLDHYMQYGAAEGRDPGPRFSSERYLERRPDARQSTSPPLVHFLREGILDVHGGYPEFGLELRNVTVRDSDCIGLRLPKKTAVFVTHDMNIGGAPYVLASLANWFRNSTDYEIRIVSMSGGPLQSKFDTLGPTTVIGTKEIHDSDVDQYRDALKSFIGSEPAFTFINSAAAGDYCKINPFAGPVFAFVHEMANVLALVESQFQTLMARADHVFCGGQPVMDLLINKYKIDKAMLTNRPPFIDGPSDNDLASESKNDLRKRLGLPEASKVVMGCGVAHWRKQPDVFVQVAAELINSRHRDAHFVWLGDGEDLPKLKSLVAELKIESHVTFAGHQDDIRPYFRAADIFVLPSVEDPFPLVCLEAAIASMPSIVFREATGMTELIEPKGRPAAGLAVPLGDVGAFGEAVDSLLCNEQLREILGYEARERALTSYTTTSACREILHTIRRIAKLAPRVSVIVPSYNSEKYLKQRLDSISDQTFGDYEVILLDDKSQDNSVAYLREYNSRHFGSILELAETNGGGVFNAWRKGLAIATGDLIWIAEADDWCEPDFLAKCVAAFDLSGVRLVHGFSVPVGERGEPLGNWRDLYLDAVAPGRFGRSYCVPAVNEVLTSLGKANTIPNVSAVLTLRSAALRAIEFATRFRLAGDWAFYLVAIVGGRVAYCKEAVNYHRRHDNSITHSVQGTDTYFNEILEIRALIDKYYGLNYERQAAFDARFRSESERYNFNVNKLSDQPDLHSALRRSIGVAFAVGDLAPGGAQIFGIRFANEWVRELAPSVLLIGDREQEHAAVLAQVSPDIPVLRLEEVRKSGLRRFMKDWGVDVIISGHWWADRTIGELVELEDDQVPWMIVMHGCYENVLDRPTADPERHKHFYRAERFCKQWVWTAEKNKRIFEEGHIKPIRLSHIVNGLPLARTPSSTRKDFGFPEDALIFTLASRAIQEKGWPIAVAAMSEVREKWAGKVDVRLLLIGDGPEYYHLKTSGIKEGVHLVPHNSKLADYIRISDVCLLPSWFAGESMPLVLLEFLAQGKPAIVSDIGMCPWVIDASFNSEYSAGIVVPRRGADGSVLVEDLAAAMNVFVSSPPEGSRMRENARSAFKKFSMDRMLSEYKALCLTLLESR